jgi:hypothetical protein
MKLDRLSVRGVAIGKAASAELRDRLLQRFDPPPGIAATPVDDGILLSGKRLRHRWATDSKTRNSIR